MCGIWLYLIKKFGTLNFYNSFMRLKNRGPDRSFFLEEFDPYNIKIGFHRLSIMDLSRKGDQPFRTEYESNKEKRFVYTICNGEIYNFKELIKKYNLNPSSSSDCEIIPLLYQKIGIDALQEILGEFAGIIIDLNSESPYDIKTYVFRDPYGIRPLFMCIDEFGINFSSELKGLVNINNKPTNGKVEGKIEPIKPGHCMELYKNNNIWSEPKYKLFYTCDKIYPKIDQEFSEIKKNIVSLLTEAVKCRLNSDRPLGCLLSGGLDSSLVASIASKFLKEKGQKLKTFSIGMEDSEDEKYALMVAKHIDSEHTHILLDENVWINSIKDVVECTETYDITTIRASTGQYLISKWISKNRPDIKVLLIGDGSDELCSGYIYFHNAPTPEDSHKENIRILKDISFFDVLRADRGIASNGLEARVPYLDIRFTDYYLSLDPKLRTPINGIEKWLLRQSFDTTDYEYLPKQVLYRTKCALSDGVSSTKKSWYKIIQDNIEKKYSNQDFDTKKSNYKHCIPVSKESLYFRELFEQLYGTNIDHVIPYYWLPKWCGDTTEPSARTLDIYKKNKQIQERLTL
jgi:Asparagine synthase (glutamine-hydrolyzing)